MRIQRLDLIRYGCFTEVSIDFPVGDTDLHVIVGPNEAGKSTVMSAVEDLLFGIPARSALNFAHSYQDMRIGATLESNGTSLAVQRRKGIKKTLLAADGVPFPHGESVLAPFIRDADRSRLERMFSLDHARLRKGGREILDAKGDVGEALFSAGSGFADLRKRRRELDAEANDLWSKRRSAKRRFYIADDLRKDAEAELRQHTVSARKWHELKAREETCRRASKDLRSELEAREADLRKLVRIRRLKRFVDERIELEEEIRNLGRISQIPRNASQTLQEAESERLVADRQIDVLAGDIQRADTERKGLRWDESVLLRADKIDRVYDRWIQVQKSRIDLPKREAELRFEVQRLRRLGRELGWTDRNAPDLLARIPPRSAVRRARALLTERTSQLAHIRSTRSALEESESRLAESQRRLDEIKAPADVSRLSAVVSAKKTDFGDIGSQVRSAETEFANAQEEVQAAFSRLHPKPDTPEAADTLVTPSKEEVQSHRDRRLQLDKQLADCRDSLRSAETKLAQLKSRRDRIQREERPVSRKDVLDLRESRDAGWDLVRRKHILGQTVPEQETRRFAGGAASLADAYEDAVRAADRAVDRSVATASATARLEEVDLQIERASEEVGTLTDKLRHRSGDSELLDREWREMWSDAPFTALRPDAMLSWLDSRDSLRRLMTRRSEFHLRLNKLRMDEQGAIKSVVAELRALGIDPAPMQAKGLLALLELASGEQQRHETRRETRASLETGLRQGTEEVARKRKEARRAESAEREWQGRWSKAARSLGLATGADPDSAETQISVIDEMRLVQAEIANLQDKRIRLMRRDIADFERELRRVVVSVAPDLASQDPDDVVPELRKRLEHSRQACKDAETKDKAIAGLKERLQHQQDAKRRAQDRILSLQGAAGVETIDGLRLEIDKAERAGQCESKLSQVTHTLKRDGDGLSVRQMQQECRGVDLDKAASREKDLRAEIEDLRKGQLEARDNLREAREQFATVGGNDVAAVAESARQNALAEISEVAAQYVRARSASLVLRWAIERNRREKQGPMLKRAGELFSELTLHSFEALEVDFDDKDRTRLVGRRPDGKRVRVKGMSSGSADQLYLALRAAALEHYLEDAQPLPFIADDLFINFDDQRSGAGFRVLARLAQKCQVIYFTHHEHLAEVARRAVHSKFRIWSMGA